MVALHPNQVASVLAGIAITVRVIDGKRVQYRQVTCHRCGASEEVRHKLDAPADRVRQCFEAKGWSGFGGRLVCPTCSRRGRKPALVPTAALPPASSPTMRDLFRPLVEKAEAKLRAQKEFVVKPKNIAEPIREPTLDEAAAIFRKLDECFEDGRYLDGWSDRKVGEALNLPWAMVSRVRDKFRGPIKEDPAIADLRSDIESWMAMGAELRARLDKLVL